MRQPSAYSRNVAQWQSREHGGRGRPDTGSSPVVPIWSMCVNGPEGCGTQLNSHQAGTVQIVMAEITRNLSGIRDSPERRASYGALMEDPQQVKPLLILPLMQMKVRFLPPHFQIGSALDTEQIRMKRYTSDRRSDRRAGINITIGRDKEWLSRSHRCSARRLAAFGLSEAGTIQNEKERGRHG